MNDKQMSSKSAGGKVFIVADRAGTPMGEMLDTYSWSHSCKFNYSKSFLLGWYEHGQNIPILEVEKKRKEQLSNGNRER